MRKQLALRILAALALASAFAAKADTFDSTTGTNVTSQVAGMMTGGGNIMLPIMLAFLGIGAGVGVYRFFSRKSGVRT